MAAYSLKYPAHTDFKVRLVSQERRAVSHLFYFRHQPVRLTLVGPGSLWQCAPGRLAKADPTGVPAF